MVDRKVQFSTEYIIATRPWISHLERKLGTEINSLNLKQWMNGWKGLKYSWKNPQRCVVNIKLIQAGFELAYSPNRADAWPIELSSQLGREQVQIHI